MLFIVHELSYDKFNEKGDRIYRLVLNGKIGGQELSVSSSCSPIGPTMVKEFPEVENFVRLNSWGQTILKNGTQSFMEKDFMEADSTFFDIFSIPLLMGEKKTALNGSHTVVLSESTAQKIFGKENPMDKMLKVGDDSVLYRVTGVMADIPEASHFTANAIGSFVTNQRANDAEWLSNSFSTYLLLKPNTSAKQVNGKIPDMLKKYVGPQILQYMGISMEEFLAKGNKYSMDLQALKDIHLDPSIQQDMKPASDPKYLMIFGSIALLIIIIAAINFMNLSTAQASKRAKEVGMKKVSGSSRGMLIAQFIAESMLLTVIALVLAVLIVELTLPYFNSLLNAKLQIDYIGNWYSLPGLIGFSLIVGMLAGSYPAFFLSSFSPYEVLKGKIKGSMKNGKLRQVLVVLQFTISIILIVGTIIMFRQINFMTHKDLGFKKEQLVVITRAETIGNRMKSFKDALYKIPGVVKVSASTAVPGHGNNNNGYMLEGRQQETFLMQTAWVDYDYLETYGHKMVAGRFFSEEFPTDQDACVVNESAVKQFTLVNPLNMRFIAPSQDPSKRDYMPIVGVVKDFNFESLQMRINPHVFRFKKEGNNWGYITVKIAPTDINKTMAGIETVWKEFTSNDPLNSFFLDADFARLYKEERQNAQLAVAICHPSHIYCLAGIVWPHLVCRVEQRTKEIGIRKTLGSLHL